MNEVPVVAIVLAMSVDSLRDGYPATMCVINFIRERSYIFLQG